MSNAGIFRTIFHRSSRSCYQKRLASISRTQRRHKSDGSAETDIVVEKEKETQTWALAPLAWDNIALKFAQARGHLKEVFSHPSETRLRGRGFRDDEILYYFREKEDLQNWFVATDDCLGGKSWAEFVQGENGMTGTFRGYVSQRLPRYMLPSTYDQLENKPLYRGFALLETLPFESALGHYDQQDISGFNMVEIRLRGEGRRYYFEMLVDYGVADFMYCIPVHTRGGPDWETVRLPYSKFMQTTRSALCFHQEMLQPSMISNFRFLLLDSIEGSFQLELDYIGLTRDMTENTDGGSNDYWDPNRDTNVSIGTW